MADKNMRADKIIQIKVDGQPVGIIGLKEVFEDLAKTHTGKAEQDIERELLQRLGKKNYIPSVARSSYGKAFLREFKKFMGLPVEEERTGGLEIKVLGPGCPQCDGLEQALMQVMSELNIQANIEHIRDIKEIGKYGIMGMPALIIGGKVKSVGKVPPKGKLRQWLGEAAKNQ